MSYHRRLTLGLVLVGACLAGEVRAQAPSTVPGPEPVAPAPSSQPATAPATAPTEPTKAKVEAKTTKPLPPGPAKAESGPTKPSTKPPAPELPPAPSPRRDLKSPDETRRTVRGAPPPAPVQITEELAELRKFEESAFPRPGAPRPGGASGVEAPPPARPTPRPGAETPPPSLRSDERHGRQPLEPKAPHPPARWLEKLALPGLAVRWDPRVIRYLEFYRDDPRGRAIMAAWLKRMGRLRPMITRVLKKHDLPLDLAYVAMVESGFNPKLTSSAGAAGVWQFMRGTGKGYGLQRDHWIDERRNPELATEAAARYLKDLHARFGTWDLALAAYNAGYGAVEASIRKYNTNDYWQLCRYESGLPWSTTLYVPKVLATAIVGLNRDYFGFAAVQPDPPWRYALVSVPTSVTLAQAARAAGVDTKVIEELNPELRRGRTPPASKAWLRVPEGAEKTFYANLARIKGQLARYRPHVVRLGDTVEQLAKQLGISRSSLKRINGLARDSELRPGLVILVPARATPASPVAASPTEPADEEPLLVAVPEDAPTSIPGHRRVFYRTVPRDSLRQIAAYLGVAPDRLAGWNKLEPTAKLVPNMVLQAFVPQDFDDSRVVLLDPKRIQLMVAGSDAFLNTYEERKGRRRIVYLARKNDTLSSISRRFGLSVGSLARINRFSRRTSLTEGQRVVVYVDPSKLRRLRRRGKRSRIVVAAGPRTKRTAPAAEPSRKKRTAPPAEPSRKKRTAPPAEPSRKKRTAPPAVPEPSRKKRATKPAVIEATPVKSRAARRRDRKPRP